MAANFEQVCARAADYANRRGRKLEQAERFIKRAWGRGTFGIESVSLADRSAEHINVGDTYSCTVLREGSGECIVTTWGDWFEQAEREYEADTDTIRCAYCGEFTPLCDEAMAEPEGARHSWRETVCESCGHNVGG